MVYYSRQKIKTMYAWRLVTQQPEKVEHSVVENVVDKFTLAIDENSNEDKEKGKHEKEENKMKKSHTGI